MEEPAKKPDTIEHLIMSCFNESNLVLKKEPPENMAAMVCAILGLTIAVQDVAYAIREQKKT